MIPNKRILVTGASGFIGRHLCKELQSKGFFVIGLDRIVGVECSSLSEQYAVDLTDRIAVQNVVKSFRPAFVVHLAAAKNKGVEFADFHEGFDINLTGSLNLIEACQAQSELTRFVFLGSSDEYGQLQAPFVESCREAPVTAYGVTKLAVTQFLQTFHRAKAFPAVVLRPTVIYGPGQDTSMFLPALMLSLLQGKKFKMSQGLQTRDFIYVSDVIQAIILSLTTPEIEGEIINVCSACSVKIADLARLTAQLIGNDADQLLDIGAIPTRPGEAVDYWALHEMATTLLHWKPRIDLENGLRLSIESYRELVYKL